MADPHCCSSPPAGEVSFHHRQTCSTVGLSSRARTLGAGDSHEDGLVHMNNHTVRVDPVHIVLGQAIQLPIVRSAWLGRQASRLVLIKTTNLWCQILSRSCSIRKGMHHSFVMNNILKAFWEGLMGSPLPFFLEF